MTEQNLFTDTPPVTPTETPVVNPSDPPVTPIVPQVDPFADQLSGIKNFDGTPKYSDVPKALDALGHSQTHIQTQADQIKTMETELTELRAAQAQHTAVEQFVDRVTSVTSDTPPVTPQAPSVSTDDVNSMVQAALAAQNNAAIRENNKAAISNMLTEAYGDKASEVLTAKATELNMTVEGLGSLAESQPDMVKALFAGSTIASVNPTSSSVSISLGTPDDKTLQRPEKSLLMGASSKDQTEFMRKVRDDVYKKHGVET